MQKQVKVLCAPKPSLTKPLHRPGCRPRCRSLLPLQLLPLLALLTADSATNPLPLRSSPAAMSFTAERLGCAYVLFQEALRLVLSHNVGWDDVGGTPRWRCYMQMPLHLGVFPMCVACAVWETRSLRRRGERCVDLGRLGEAERTFAYVFAYVLSVDFVYVAVYPAHTIMRPLVFAHHVACLLGHMYAVVASLAGFPCYMASVSALELGSATSNIFVLSASRGAAWLYLIGMTLSNLAATALLLLWARRARPRGRLARGLPVVITAVLMAFRQREVWLRVPPRLV